jgi:polysaccharide pyruvyl transferase WcaK-like protein
MATETQAIDPIDQSSQLRDEWVAAVDALYREVEDWAISRRWTAERESVVIEEKKIGHYPTWNLVVRTSDRSLLFQPVARQIVGATGRVDLTISPATDPALMIVRGESGVWLVHPFGDSEVSQTWDENHFDALTLAHSESVG